MAMNSRSFHPSRGDELGVVTHQPIDLTALLAGVSGSGRGGTAAFLGTVRNAQEDGPVASIEYSGYPEMIEAEGDRIVEEASTRWPEAKLAIQHRLGDIALGDASIAVVAAAPHRNQAFEVCRFGIEEAKRRLPVWKKETFTDGERAWRE
jgi:molybdopterin synthase catalytic subunit